VTRKRHPFEAQYLRLQDQSLASALILARQLLLELAIRRKSPAGEKIMARLIEFYTPATHKPATQVSPRSSRGEIITFPGGSAKPVSCRSQDPTADLIFLYLLTAKN